MHVHVELNMLTSFVSMFSLMEIHVMSAGLGLARAVSLFILAGLCEIGGGWLVWKWLRDGRPSWWGLLGGLVLMLYGIIPTFQNSHFGRIYAVYGGFFIVLSLLWGWAIDGDQPDMADTVGSAIALIGVGLMMWWPRG